MIKFRSDSPGRFSRTTIATAMTGVALVGAGLSVGLVNSAVPSEAARTSTVQVSKSVSGMAPGEEAHTAKLPQPLSTINKAEKKAALPSGISTGTSFWDAQTASGKPMSYHTVASPYWPLGTKVKVTIGKKSAVGVVEDFGPAEWAVAQHNPPAIIDLSEEMMQYLTGTRSNSVPVKFQVLSLGNGPVYRHSGTGYDMATGVTEK
jgi:rare lipoprotein A (peptidoglycan hydrolase)